MSIASVKQSLMNGVTAVHRISCMAIESRHGRGGTARHMFWWKSLARDVAKFVFTCVACQRNKACRHKPYGLLQPLLVPEKPWHTVSFDLLSNFLRRAGITIVFLSLLTSSLSWFTLWLARKKCLRRNLLSSTSTMSFVFMD
jgi:hypothetical protein